MYVCMPSMIVYSLASPAPQKKFRVWSNAYTPILFPPPESGGAYFACIAYGVGVV